MASIEVRIENWKNKLLDVGKRNKLISFHETKRSNIKVILPDMDTLFDDLVKHDAEFEFIEIQSDDSQIDRNKLSVGKGEILTNRNKDEQYKNLLNLRNKAKTTIEEQGVNILHMAFGFLKWTEAEQSTHTLLSPILLVPVKLTIESIISRLNFLYMRTILL